MKPLKDLPAGTMGQIVHLKNDSLMERLGAHVGMTVMVLGHAVQSIIQIGTQQIEVAPEVLGQILVEEI